MRLQWYKRLFWLTVFVACVLATILVTTAAFVQLGKGQNSQIVFLDYEARTKNVDFSRFTSELKRLSSRDLSVRRISVDLDDTISMLRTIDSAALSQSDLIVAPASAIALAVRSRHPESRMIFCTIADPIQVGLKGPQAGTADALTTGYSYNSQLERKQLEILSEIKPGMKIVGLLVDDDWNSFPELVALPSVILQETGLMMLVFNASSAADLEQLKTRTKSWQGVDAWLVPETSLARDLRDEVLAFIAATDKPAIYGHSRMVEQGGLAAFYVDPEEAPSILAAMTISVINGIEPGALPVERPNRFGLSLNLAAARKHPAWITRRLLLQADVVL